MKICHIAPWFPSINPTTPESLQGIFEYRQTAKLSEKGHEFKVISIKWRGQSYYEKINNGIEVYRIPYIFNFPTINYPIPNFIRLINEIKDICNNWHPDILVFSHMEYLTALPTLYLKDKIEIPILVTTGSFPGVTWFCGNKIVDTVGYLHSMLIGKKVLKVVDGIQFLNSGLYNVVPKMNIDVNKVFLMTMGVDTELFKPRAGNNSLRKELGIKGDDVVILYVGRLESVKGVTYLLQAAKKMHLHYKDTKFLIVGDGSLRRKHEKLAKSFLDSIIFTGHREDIPELMNISDIFVLPSLSEDMSCVVMEACASGLPVISTEVGETPVFILNNKTGILIKPMDVGGLIGALKKLIDDTLLAKRMGVAGRIRMEEEYSWEIICKKIEKMYENIINNYK